MTDGVNSRDGLLAIYTFQVDLDMSHSVLPETKESFNHQALAKVQRRDLQFQTK